MQDIGGVPHNVLPVLNPTTGDVDTIAVPTDTPMADFHSALSDYYHPVQPDAQGSVENSAGFKTAAAQAVALMHASEMRGRGGHEAGFSVSRTGQTSKVDVQPDIEVTGKGHMTQTLPPNTLGSLHTHDSGHGDMPSAGDVNAAKQAKTTIYVASRSGLHAVDPGGNITQVFKSPTWATDKTSK